MKVLQVNDADLRGRRFSGFDLIEDLAGRGIDASQAVLIKSSASDKVFALLEDPVDQALNDALWRVEQKEGMDGLLYPWARVLAESEEFREADVVHYHLLHNRMLSLLDLPWLFSTKPSVWSFHDSWPITGHCVQPLGCSGWISGCDPCPYLDRWFGMQVDRAGQMWALKQRVYAELEVDIVAASDLMLDDIKRSPLTAHFEHVHLIPFGVRGDLFLPDSEKVASRDALGIPRDDFVLLSRAAPGTLKGTDVFVDSMGLHPPTRPTTLATLDSVGLLHRLHEEYSVREFGWVDDQELYSRLLSACDVFVMPSRAESFGLMALEAMAAGRPVVCLEGTAVESVVRSPECGLAVPPGDPLALREAIDSLSHDPEGIARRGRMGREIAGSDYGIDRYLDGLCDVYREVLTRKRRE
ncbi:MAG: glycosyltransferase [Coriobacteriia bacterium]|nr:glycosyltransferase [Coriobacteriia bacterium]